MSLTETDIDKSFLTANENNTIYFINDYLINKSYNID